MAGMLRRWRKASLLPPHLQAPGRRSIMKCTTMLREVVECRHYQEDLGAQSMIC
jgi:hypothetical protein